MHRLICSLSLPAGALLLAACGCNDTVIPAGEGDHQSDGKDRGQWLSMGLLPSGTPVAAFYNRTDGGLEFGMVTAAGDGSPRWSFEQVDGFPDENGLNTGNRGTFASMAVASDGAVWVAYRDVSNKTLRYARRAVDLAAPIGETRATWEHGQADSGGGSSPDAGHWASLALDPQEQPVVAHYDAGKGELRVVRWADVGFGSATVISGEPFEEGEETAAADVGQFARLHIDESGIERILYYDAAHGALRLAVGEGSSYTVHTVDDEGDVGQWPSILVEDDGTLHIAYHDVGNQHLRYATGTPGAFTTEVVDDGELAGADSEVFMDGGFVSIVYFSGAANDMMLARRAGSSWSTSILAGDDAALGFHNEVLEFQGTPWVGCYDYTNRTILFQPIQ